MSLQISAGYVSLPGPRERNEDFCGLVTPSGSELATKGVLAALADGVSGGVGGREAAESTVRGLLADYYATPDTWTVPHALDRVLQAVNQWLFGRSGANRELAGMATTLSALVVRGRHYYVAHVGDSRIYLMRNGRLQQLTTDHVWDHPEMHHVLTRAIGLDAATVIDYADGTLEKGDVFMLVSDGVWEPLGDLELARCAVQDSDAKAAANALVGAAIAAGGNDNASALVLRVHELPHNAWHDTLAEQAHSLPVPPRLRPGQGLDGFVVLELLHDSRATLLYKVRRPDGSLGVLKTLQPTLADDREQCAALLAEEWLARRVISHYFPQIVPLAAEQRSFLYYLMSFHDGATVREHLAVGRHFTVAEAVTLGIRVLKGLATLHRMDIVHRDIKPDNLHLGTDGKLRILDLGVAQSALGQIEQGVPGTPSFIAPELFAGGAATAQSDLFATGVTLYHLLTRKYPYGEIEPFQHPRFGDPLPPTRYRPDIPGWLESILLKAVARDPKLRFETSEEFLLALERGERRPLVMPLRTPLAARDAARLWQSIATVAVVINLLLLYVILAK